MRSHECAILKIKKQKTNKKNNNPTPIRSLLFMFDIGSVISIFPALQIGKLHHQALEKEKNLLLKQDAGNFWEKSKKYIK